MTILNPEKDFDEIISMVSNANSMIIIIDH
jgi:hypothetical protein